MLYPGLTFFSGYLLSRCVLVLKIVCLDYPGMAQDQTWLESDKEIPGQKYVCLSFLSPEKVLANKDVFFFNRFLENYEVDYKVSASEKFLMDQVLQVTKVMLVLQVRLVLLVILDQLVFQDTLVLRVIWVIQDQ